MTTTHQTPILDDAYTVRTVSTVEDGKQYVTTYITNNDNDLILGGKDTKRLFEGSVPEYHEWQTLSAVEMLNLGSRWESRRPIGETTIITK